MKKELVCIECPRGCTLSVEILESVVKSVTGNRCDKGRAYAISETVNPHRVVTGTVRIKAYPEMLPVRTDRAVEKSKIFQVMRVIKSTEILTPIKIGDIIIKNVDGEGANVIASASVE